MIQTKFKYYFTDHAPVIFTLRQLEAGCLNEASFRGAGKIIGRAQYTGLKDKNGVEIYEGDIITGMGFMTIGTVLEVVFYEKFAQFVGLLGEGVYWIQGDEQQRIQVVGNAYQNPELLGGV